MCRNNEVDCNLLNLLHYFITGFNVTKLACLHGEAFEIQHEIFHFYMRGALKNLSCKLHTLRDVEWVHDLFLFPLVLGKM